jgi:hypothetical protein
MSQLSVQLLLNTETVAIRDVVCGGECRHKSAEECAHVRAADRRALGQLTDWELKDIGISRAEAGAEAEKWFWRP